MSWIMIFFSCFLLCLFALLFCLKIDNKYLRIYINSTNDLVEAYKASNQTLNDLIKEQYRYIVDTDKIYYKLLESRALSDHEREIAKIGLAKVEEKELNLLSMGSIFDFESRN